MKAKLKNYRQSPRKVRLVAKAIRGKSVARARSFLRFTNQKSSDAILKLIDSALANAGIDKSDNKAAKDLLIKEIRVDEGIVFKRWMPRAFGRATPYKKRHSHIALTLDKK